MADGKLDVSFTEYIHYGLVSPTSISVDRRSKLEFPVIKYGLDWQSA